MTSSNPALVLISKASDSALYSKEFCFLVQIRDWVEALIKAVRYSIIYNIVVFILVLGGLLVTGSASISTSSCFVSGVRRIHTGISIMATDRKPLNVLYDYPGKDLEQPG